MAVNVDKILNQKYYMKFSDGSTWAVPVHVIAMHHAMSHVRENDLMEYMHGETLPLFEDSSEVEDWAKNNMDWNDVQHEAVQVRPPNNSVNFQNEWLNSDVIVK